MCADAQFTRFILEHEGDDTAKLLFAADRFPGIDVRSAATVIEARRKAKSKLPSWYAEPGLTYPDSLSMEQCSSEATAQYKQRFVSEGDAVADITGGLGVDSSFLARKASKLVYHERNAALCQAASHNFSVLGLDNISVVNTETSSGNLPKGHFNLIFADPARRSKTAGRVYSIADCEPDILSLKNSLLEISNALLIKISPMADVVQTLRQIPEATELHIVSLDGEVKELLVWCRSGFARGLSAEVVCADLSSKGPARELRMTLDEETASVPSFAEEMGQYLFLPSRSLLKAGAFRLCSNRFALAKLAPSTHLYTSNCIPENFPGKIYKVKEAVIWSKSAADGIVKRFPTAEMTSVNFPLPTEELRKKTKIKEGGNIHIFATTFKKDKILLICERFIENNTSL